MELFCAYTFQIYILSAVRVQSWWAYGVLMVGLPYPHTKPKKNDTKLTALRFEWLLDFALANFLFQQYSEMKLPLFETVPD